MTPSQDIFNCTVKKILLYISKYCVKFSTHYYLISHFAIVIYLR